MRLMSDRTENREAQASVILLKNNQRPDNRPFRGLLFGLTFQVFDLRQAIR